MRHSHQSGMGFAYIDNNIQGYGSTFTRTSWGGSRNSRDRASDCLTPAQCKAMIAAAGYSQRLGFPFNRHWTIHYQKADVADTQATAFIGRLLKLARDYAARNKAPFTAIWARENGDGKGGHVHILLHLPTALSLKGRTRKWVRLAGGICRPGVSVIKAVGGRLSSADIGDAHYCHNVAIVEGYLLKGASVATGRALGLRLYGETGRVIGKRCGWTQNIGQSARARGRNLDAR